jgi:predicted alpha/beta superfamily hydrolase
MIKKWFVTIPQLSGEMKRRVYLYLPDSYQKEPDKRYPVLYMFDGHNVFFDADATYGKSWGMRDYMRKSKKQLIIVAVECDHEGNSRLQEYSPYNFDAPKLGPIRGKGAVYMNWLTKTLKPYIDSNFRTLPDRDNTLIAGSSMGGLMALYGVCAYNQVFCRAACLSPSLWVDANQAMQMIAKANLRKDTCIYMDYGSEEMDNHFASAGALMAASNLLLAKQVHLTMRIIPGGNHSEASWEKQIPIFMECLGIK